jgi:hypothetical protein
MTSQINANNIDGNYPVPGVPNNTQGFRTNFTETQTNFQYAAQEITELQNKALLKEALDGTVLDNNMSGGLISDVKLNDVSYTYLPIAATTGSIAIDYSAASFQQITTTGSVSLSFTNFPADGTAGSVRVAFSITNIAHTVTLPAEVSVGTTGIQGYSAGVITFAAVGTYQFDFYSVDGGVTITIFDLNRPLSYYTNPVTIAASTVSSGNSTGALTVAGGVGVVGNVNTGGLISATGNITGGNLITGGLVSATGNVTGGNVLSDAVISAVGSARILSGTAVPAGGTTGAGYRMSSTTNLGVFFGSGAPTLSAAQGSLYLRTDGSSTTTRMYVNTNGTTGWTNVVTSA